MTTVLAEAKVEPAEKDIKLLQDYHIQADEQRVVEVESREKVVEDQ